MSLGLPLVGGGCESSTADAPAEVTIPRETFIQAYVNLRSAALRSEVQTLDLRQREMILGRLGVTEDELLTFVEVRGEDIEFMRKVWMEVDSILRSEAGDPAGGERVGDPR